MQALQTIEKPHLKSAIPSVQSGDTVRVHQLIKEGGKTRVQVFEGVVIRTRRGDQLTANITVRRIASGVGVEKTWLLHSPNVKKVEVMRRSKVRRNFLSYLRERRGKSARLQELAFDKAAVNVAEEQPAAADEVDVATTELSEDAATDVQPEESTEEVAKEENKEAASEEAAAETVAEPGADESELPKVEAEAGVDQAESETNKE